MKTLTFAPGDVIFWQGDFSASMFDIISGKVGISRRKHEEKKRNSPCKKEEQHRCPPFAQRVHLKRIKWFREDHCHLRKSH